MNLGNRFSRRWQVVCDLAAKLFQGQDVCALPEEEEAVHGSQHRQAGPVDHVSVFDKLLPVFRIHDILVRIRIWIRGSMHLTNGSGFGSCYFRHWLSRHQQKTNLKKNFCLLLFEGTSFFKVQKKSQNSRNQRFSYYFSFMIEGFGSGRPKNMWIRIWIRNTTFYTTFHCQLRLVRKSLF